MPKSAINTQGSSGLFTRFLIIFIPFMILLAAAATTHFYTETKLLQVHQENHEASNVSLGQQGVVSQMRSVISDLTFLAKLNELWELLDNTNNTLARLKLSQEFLYFSENKGVYDQVSIIDVHGDELLRVNYGDGIPYIVEQAKLQNKADQAYFQEAVQLDVGGVFMSSFVMVDDETEPGIPPRAVIRFATPLFDTRGKKKGLLFLNIRGDRILWGFKQAARDIIDHAYIVANEGRSLGSPSSVTKGTFNSVLDKGFVTAYPSEWDRILSKDTGSFSTPSGLFTFTTAYPLASVMEYYGQTGAGVVSGVSGNKNKSARFWKIVSHIPSDKRIIPYRTFFSKHVWIYSFSSLFILALSLLLAQISNRRDIEKAQAEYEHRLQNTLDAIQFLAVSINPNGQVIYCNQPLANALNKSQNEIIGLNWFDSAVPEHQRQSIRMAFEGVIKGKAPLQTTEYWIRNNQGNECLISWNNIISFCPNGKIMTLTSIGHDITAQRANEKQLHKLSRAVEQTHDSIIVTDKKGIIEYVNRGFVETTGYSQSEAIGKTCAILKSGETTDDVYKSLWDSITSGREWRGVFRNRRKNGELYWENTMISPIRDEQEEITHYLSIKEDVTEHRQLREEVEERNRELARAQSLAEMGRMASMIAHDLRNPLSSIKMTMQIFNKRPYDNSTAQNAEELSAIALDQVRYMENILADLLLFSKPDALQPEWLQINRVLDSSVLMLQETIQKTQAKIISEYQGTLPAVHADATKLQQVFSNLVMNAIQATELCDHSPIITVRSALVVEQGSPVIQVDILDNGPGIPDDIAARIFDPFYTTKAKGTGLGLPIVKRMVEEHGGTFKISHRENAQGSYARVTLPTGPTHS